MQRRENAIDNVASSVVTMLLSHRMMTGIARCRMVARSILKEETDGYA